MFYHGRFNQLPRNCLKYDPLKKGYEIRRACRKIDLQEKENKNDEKNYKEIIKFCSKYGAFGKPLWYEIASKEPQNEYILQNVEEFKNTISTIKRILEDIKVKKYEDAVYHIRSLIQTVRIDIETRKTDDSLKFREVRLYETLEQAVGIHLFDDFLRGQLKKSGGGQIFKECQECGTPFVPKKDMRELYCSPECFWRHHNSKRPSRKHNKNQ